MANECMPYWQPGQTVTGKVKTGVTGKRFVKLSGQPDSLNPGIAPCTAGAQAFGVAAADQIAGGSVAVHSAPGAIVPVTAGGALTVDTDVESDSVGRAITKASGVALGRVLADAANGADAMIKLY